MCPVFRVPGVPNNPNSSLPVCPAVPKPKYPRPEFIRFGGIFVSIVSREETERTGEYPDPCPLPLHNPGDTARTRCVTRRRLPGGEAVSRAIPAGPERVPASVPQAYASPETWGRMIA